MAYEPITPEALDFFTEQTERAVKKAQRRGIVGAVVGFLVLFSGSMVAYQTAVSVGKEGRSALIASGRAVATDGCNRDFRTIEELRNILVLAAMRNREEYRQKEIPFINFQRAQRFYSERLDALTLPDCRKARNLLSDDPERAIRIPEPLFVPQIRR